MTTRVQKLCNWEQREWTIHAGHVVATLCKLNHVPAFDTLPPQPCLCKVLKPCIFWMSIWVLHLVLIATHHVMPWDHTTHAERASAFDTLPQRGSSSKCVLWTGFLHWMDHFTQGHQGWTLGVWTINFLTPYDLFFPDTLQHNLQQQWWQECLWSFHTQLCGATILWASWEHSME